MVVHAIRDRNWDRTQAGVADMNQRINRLEAIQPRLDPWEQQVIGHAAVLVRRLAANSEENLGTGSYKNLSAEATALARVVKVDAHDARVHARAEYLTPNLGMTELFR